MRMQRKVLSLIQKTQSGITLTSEEPGRRLFLTNQTTQGTPEGLQVSFYPLFQTALVRWLGSRRRRTSPSPMSASTRVEIAMPMAVRIVAMVIPCSRNRVRMRSASVVSSWRSRLNVSRILLIWDRRVALFVERASSLACVSSSMSESTLELSDSVSNLSLHFSVVCFRQFSMLPGEVSFDLGFSVVDTRQLRQVVCQLISHSRHCLFEPSKLSSDLGDPRGVDWLIINLRQGGLNLFCATTCAVGYAGGGGRSSSSMFSRLLGRIYLPAGVLSQRSYSDLSAMCNR